MSQMQEKVDTSEAMSLRLDKQLCFPLYATSRQMTRLYGTLLDPLGLTYPQYLVLLVLWEKTPRTVTKIGEELQLNTNTLTPLLKRLEHSKFLKRKRSRIDERVVEVTLTPEGQALREACLTIPARLSAALPFDAAKARLLRELLKELHDGLSATIAQEEKLHRSGAG